MLGNKGTKKHYRSGGTRGGQDQFKWEDVKTDKERENYLGHSVLAPVGRWQKGRDLFWYTKEGQEMVGRDRAAMLRDELDEVRQRDEDMLNEALGIKVKKRKFEQPELEQEEIKQLFMKGGREIDTVDIERIEGLGAATSRRHDHIPQQKVLSHVEKEILRLKQKIGEVDGDGNSQWEEEDRKDKLSGHGQTIGLEKDGESGKSKIKKSKKEKKQKKEKKIHKRKDKDRDNETKREYSKSKRSDEKNDNDKERRNGDYHRRRDRDRSRDRSRDRYADRN